MHSDRPFIVGVDERLDSPETATLKYEAAVARANGGEARGVTPPGVVQMATYAKAAPIHGKKLPPPYIPRPPTRAFTNNSPGFDSTRGFTDSTYQTQQYTSQAYPSQQAQTTTQLQDTFETSPTVPTVPSYVPVGPTVLSCQPTTGTFGTRLHLRVSTATTGAYFLVAFGTHKTETRIESTAQEGAGTTVYALSCLAPQQAVTGCAGGASVPLAVVIEGPGGEELSRTALGNFLYRDAAQAGEVTRDGGSPGRGQASPRRSPPQLRHAATSNTNTYEYPGATASVSGSQHTQQQQQQQQQPQQQSNTHSQYATAAFPQNASNMIGSYRNTSFDPYPRPAPLRTSAGWPTYSAHLDANRGPAHAGLSRSITSMSVPSGSAPQLIRTSTLQTGAHGGAGYGPYGMYPNKAVLEVVGKLDMMADGWTAEEWAARRRVVMFRKAQNGSTLTTTFRPLGPGEKAANAPCVSCIWWEEKGEHFVTSVDTIYLLEQLVAAPSRFTVEEKNRIRRNLEGFRPLTVSKTKADSEEFFKVIMGFPHPKPRNIEKDVKVFRWKMLEPALKKIIGKYSASPSAMGGGGSAHMITPAPYHALPTPPLSGGTDAQAGYAVHDIASPRSLSGSGAWGPYSATASHNLAARTGSPRVASPAGASMRLASLPSVTGYDSRSLNGYAGLSRWEGSYGEAYPSLSAQSQVFGAYDAPRT